MKQFEYKFVEPGFKTFFKRGDDRLTEEYGKQGWEFVTVAGGKLVFQREIVEDEVFITIIENPFGNDAIVGVHRNKGDAISRMESKDNICKEEDFPYSHRVERYDVK